MTVYQDIRKTLTARMKTLWTHGEPVAYPNQPLNPPNNQSWLRLEILTGVVNREVLTGDLAQGTLIQGSIEVQILTPLDSGDGLAMQLADLARDIWNEADIEVYAGKQKLVCKATEIRRYGPADVFYQVNVSTPFEFLTT